MRVEQEKEKIFQKFFEIVVFEGWGEHTIKLASKEAGFHPVLGMHYFPNGARDIIDLLAIRLDESLAATTQPKTIEKMRVHERIMYLVKRRLMLYEPYRDALEAYGVHLVFPKNATASLNAIARTVDLIWFMAGDKSTDHNYYTKRGLLGLVYVSTAIYWMQDRSENYKDSWEFLDRRIQDVLRFGKTVSQLNPGECVKDTTNLLGDVFKAPKRFWERLNNREL